jgi:hypothetical protein
MKITIDWTDPKSISSALKEIEEYQKKIIDIEKKFCLKLAEIGRQRAQEIYDAVDTQDGNYPPNVYVEETEQGAKIVAHGEDVCFIEFGAGTAADGSTHDGFTFTPSSWSSSELGAHQFETLGFWVYDGKTYTAIQPQHAMTKAIAEMESRANEVARELKGELT